jgi:hypothetical protein
MKAPDHYVKGVAHTPSTTVGGHFTGMVPSPHDAKPGEMWYRADEYVTLALERNHFKAGLDEIIARFDAEDVDILDFLEIAERYLK